MKSKVLFLTAALVGASVAVTPVQAHDDLLPLYYGIGGLLLIDAITDHHHDHRHKERVIIYDDHRYRHDYRRDHSHGGYSKPRYRNEKRWRHDDGRRSKERHRSRDWD